MNPQDFTVDFKLTLKNVTDSDKLQEKVNLALLEFHFYSEANDIGKSGSLNLDSFEMSWCSGGFEELNDG